MAGKLIPGIGAIISASDAYDRYKAGDYVGAGLSAGTGVSSLIPVVGAPITAGLLGAQIGRDIAQSDDEPAAKAPKEPKLKENDLETHPLRLKHLAGINKKQ